MYISIDVCKLLVCFVGVGLYMDSQAGLDFLLSRRDIDRKKIIVFGRSLGGAVAIYLAASHANRDK
jgi:pimeloyl-ACP methyl ester carboxylesterase